MNKPAASPEPATKGNLRSPEFKAVFERLRSILTKYEKTLVVMEDSATRYCLGGHVGPATLRAWGGEMRSPMIPVAWVQIGKGYVSYHLMAVYGNPKLCATMSKELAGRMQGKSCFNFKVIDEKLFAELDELTDRGCKGMKRAGFV